MEIVAGVAAMASEHRLGVVLVVETGGESATPGDLLGLVTRHRPVGVVLAFSDPGSIQVTRLGRAEFRAYSSIPRGTVPRAFLPSVLPTGLVASRQRVI